METKIVLTPAQHELFTDLFINKLKAVARREHLSVRITPEPLGGFGTRLDMEGDLHEFAMSHHNELEELLEACLKKLATPESTL
jgi:hypothetical protein